MRRILTAAILIPTVISIVLWGHPYLLVAVQLIFAVAGVWEFFQMSEAKGIPAFRFPGYVFTVIVVALSLTAPESKWILAAIVLFLLILFGTGLHSGVDLETFLPATCATLFSVIYVALPCSLLLWVLFQPRGRTIGLFAMILVWTGDSSAWAVGSKWGRHKMAQHISPKKSWEGAAGSFAGCIALGIAMQYFWFHDMGILEAAVLAAIINVAAQIGDLAESALKRSAGVKDSSQLVPGHGGVLDRIDGLLFASMVIWYYWLWRSSAPFGG